MTEELKVGLVGAGVFAGYHAGKVAAHSRASLSGVFEPDQSRAEALAAQHGCDAFSDLDRLASASDALIIASPASYHAGAAIKGLLAGCHLLVEKPLATSVAIAEAIVNEAGRIGRVLQVGHQERIVMEAIGLKAVDATPREIRIVRNSPRATRNLDTSIVMDMMVHDLDLLNWLYGSPAWISAEQTRSIYSEHIDEARAELGYEGMTAYLQSSRDADSRRRWVLDYADGTVAIDFGDKTLRHDTPFALNPDFGDDPAVQDSLAAAFDRFVRACLDGTPPLASGADGLAAVSVAAAIEGTP
ncbi:Gfo/Idh/MocA family protein [Algimonas porphyrae]|uniref:Oxidoreductase n=1 Tax=Algimonas porphyrae TaxID=1128113 RepID=A0ABQ5UVK9_9PROT|nr:Gfo/Idh/MocA family oxidoreductase [Algimonas porphyrae]GLQ19183.1 oxidoreductase [Algimonas porphyrae]